MSYFLGISSEISNITNPCPNGVPVFLYVLGLCVVDIRGWLAVICGLLAILCWTVYGLPQMIMNCRRGIPDEAISPWLLIFWTIGDTSNLVGAILTRQLLLQIVMAGYSIFCDIILVGQYTFSVLNKKWKKHVGPQNVLNINNGENLDSVSVNAKCGDLSKSNSVPNMTKTSGAALFCISIFLLHIKFFPLSPIESKYVGRTLLSSTLNTKPKPFIEDYKEILGYILGCLSTLFYSSGRIPQIFMNYRRKCTNGLSFGLFMFALFGNATYGAQILLVSTDRNYLLKHLPWIIGSWGVMFLDCLILIQFFIYRRRTGLVYHLLTEDLEDDDEDRENHS